MSTGIYINLIYKIMKNYAYIKNQFIEKHETIDNEEYLNMYINFLINYKLDINITYTEKHHILPQSVFPEYKKEEWNIVELSYEHHKLLHLWLFKAINIRKYQRPLNWMINYYKNKTETSNAAKKGWINLKNNKEKFKQFCEKKSNYMKTLSSMEQSRRANIFWNNISDNDYLKFCNNMKNIWTEEKKIKKSKSMKEFFKNPENIKKKSIESKQKWNRKTQEERTIFKNKMNIINKNIEKRKIAGDKIKKLWENTDFLQKMKNRKHRSGLKLKLITIDNNEIIFDSMSELSKKYNFSPHLIRKYRDKNIKIEKDDLTYNNINLLNCIIQSIKK